MSKNYSRPAPPNRFFEQSPTDFGLPIARRWLLTAQPFPDESLASWFARQADLMGSNTEHLAKLVVNEIGKSGGLTYRDIDMSITEPALMHLAECANIPSGIFFTLAAGKLLGNKPSVRPLIPRAMLRRHYAGNVVPVTHLCPECLASDRIPYLRRSWRYGWIVSCRQHQKSLIDACPHCNDVFPTTEKFILHLLHRECPTCGERLDVHTAPELMPEAARLEEAIDQALSTGIWEVGMIYHSTSAALLAMVGQLFPALLVASVGRDNDFFILRDRRLFMKLDQQARTFAGAPLSLRQDILKMITLLLEDWPDRMIRIVAREHIGSPWNPWPDERLKKTTYADHDYDLYTRALFKQLSLPLKYAFAQNKSRVSKQRRRKVPYEELLLMMRCYL